MINIKIKNRIILLFITAVLLFACDSKIKKINIHGTYKGTGMMGYEAVVDAVIPAAGRIDPGFLDVQETFVNGVDERECIGCGVDGPAVEQGTAPDGESGGGNGRRLARQQFLPFFPENPGDKPIDGGHSTRE